MSMSKPLYYVSAVPEERYDDEFEQTLLAVWGCPPHEITFESVWEQAKEKVLEQGGIEGCGSTFDMILDQLEEWGWVITDHSDVPLKHVEY